MVELVDERFCPLASRPIGEGTGAAGAANERESGDEGCAKSGAKGGMDGIDQEKIAQITLETAANSSFTAHQRKLDSNVERRIARIRQAQRKLDMYWEKRNRRTMENHIRMSMARENAEEQRRRELAANS